MQAGKIYSKHSFSVVTLVVMLGALLPLLTACDWGSEGDIVGTETVSNAEQETLVALEMSTSASVLSATATPVTVSVTTEPAVPVPTEIRLKPTLVPVVVPSPTTSVAPTPIPSPSPTIEIQSTPIILPIETPISTASSNPTSTVVPTTDIPLELSPTATAEPTVEPTSLASPTVAAVDTATPLPVPIFVPTPRPTTVPDIRYGVVQTSTDAHVAGLGVKNVISYDSRVDAGSTGAERIIFIKSVSPVPTDQITQGVQQGTGATWYVLGEPNAHGVQVADVVVGLHDTYAAIKSADPTAKITSPSLLNFEYLCDGTCGGYQTGSSWAAQFISQYMDLYGVSPPIDYWAMDSYPIRWKSSNPITVDSSVIKSDLTAMRQYLDSTVSEAGKPIIITEMGIHWGFESVTIDGDICSGWYPSGEYRNSQVWGYLSNVFTWLEANSGTLNIDSWFLYSTFRDMTACQSDMGYGLSLYESASSSSGRTYIGDRYYDWIRNIRP